jgi:glutamine synthetase
LAEAVEVMESSELVAGTLGEHVFDYFLRNKRREWSEYIVGVTPWELERFLPRL